MAVAFSKSEGVLRTDFLNNWENQNFQMLLGHLHVVIQINRSYCCSQNNGPRLVLTPLNFKN